MNLVEAVKSEKPFRRKGEDEFIDQPLVNGIVLDEYEILATDWEVKPDSDFEKWCELVGLIKSAEFEATFEAGQQSVKLKHGDKEIHELKEENKKLRECVELIHRGGYTGASFIAGECLNKLSSNQQTDNRR